MTQIQKHLYKNVEFLMTEGHLEELKAHVEEEPTNNWLKLSLQPIVETDINGLIVMFKPSGAMTMGLVHFFQNLMVAQRCFLMDEFMRKQGVIE